jgi:hypothetical protein
LIFRANLLLCRANLLLERAKAGFSSPDPLEIQESQY